MVNIYMYFCFNNISILPHWADNKLSARSFIYMTVILTCGKNSFIHLCVGTHAWYHLRNIISLNITTTDDLHNILTHRQHHIHNTRRGKLIWGWTLFYVLLLLFQIILGGAGCCNLIEFMCIFCFLIATTSPHLCQ